MLGPPMPRASRGDRPRHRHRASPCSASSPSLPTSLSRSRCCTSPDDNSRWFVVAARRAQCACSTTRRTSRRHARFINIASQLNSNPQSANDECGLLGMAFHPELPDGPARVLCHTRNGSDARARRSRLGVPYAGRRRDPRARTELQLLTVDHPESNHNGGNIAFGPDGFLYIGIGDGGGARRPARRHRQRPAADDAARQDAAHRRRSNSSPRRHTRFRPVRTAIRSRRIRGVRRGTGQRPTAPRSTPTASAIRGAGASIASTASCGSPTSARAHWEEVNASCSAAITAGAAAKARTTSITRHLRLRVGESADRSGRANTAAALGLLDHRRLRVSRQRRSPT